VDGAETPRVIVVNETLARQVWRDREAVGQRLILDYRGGAYPYEVVAVVNDTRFRGLKTTPRPELFIPHAQNPYLDLSVVPRTAEEPASLLRTVRREIRALDPLQPIHGFVTMDDLVRRSVSADRLATVLLGLLAGLRSPSRPRASTAFSRSWWRSAPRRSACAWPSARRARRSCGWS
jgi:hypothetical protein